MSRRSLVFAIAPMAALAVTMLSADQRAGEGRIDPAGTRAAAERASDWVQWRGAHRDGVIGGFTPPAAWPDQLIARWKVSVGSGYATPLLVGDRLYVFSRLGDDEVMTAHDPSDGSVIWRRAYPAPFTMNRSAARHGPGPKSTPVFAGGRLYAIGMTGVVTCFDAATGDIRWQKPGSPIVPTFTTHAFSPIVEGDVAIFHVGGNNQGALTAFDLDSGDVRWSWPGDGPSYGSPVVVDLDGTRQLITLTQTKLVGVDVATGTLLWERPFTNSSVTNSATPIVHGRTVVVSNGGPAVAVRVSKAGDRWTVEDGWENADVPYRLSNAVLDGTLLFGLSTRNSGQYYAVDVTTGQTLWTSEGRQATNAAIERAGDLFFSLEDDGELLVVRSSGTAFEPLKRYKVAETDTWTQPVIAGNRIFVKDESTLSLWTLN